MLTGNNPGWPGRMGNRPTSVWVATGAWAAGSLLALGYISQGTLSLLFEKPYVNATTFFFREQFLALVNGRLYVTTGLLGECLVFNGECYGYYGLTPSLLRAPLVLTGVPGSGSPLMGWLAVSVAIALSLWLTAALRGRNQSPAWFVIGSLTVALASPLLIDMTRSAATEAIAWSAAFTILGIAGFIAWSRSGRGWWLVLVAAALVLGANARPGVAAAGPLIALAVLLCARAADSGVPRGMTGGGGRSGGRLTVPLLAAGIAVLPLLGVLAVFWLKFRQLIPDLTLHEAYPELPVYANVIAANDGQLAGLRFLPSLILFYLRPLGIGLTDAFPWLMWRGEVMTLPPLGPGSIVNQGGVSITATYPLVVVLAVLLGVASVRRLIEAADHGSLRRLPAMVAGSRLTPMALIVLASAAPASTTLMFHGVTPRYIGDFTALIVVVTATGCGYLARRTLPTPVFTTAFTAAMVLTVWSVLTVNAFAIRLAAPLLLPAPVAARAPALISAGVICESPRSLTAQRLGNVTAECQLTMAAFADPTANTLLASAAEPTVRAAVAESTRDPQLLARLAADDSPEVRQVVASRGSTPRDALAALAADPVAQVRLAVAANPDAPRQVLRELADDPDPEIAAAARANPRL